MELMEKEKKITVKYILNSKLNSKEIKGEKYEQLSAIADKLKAELDALEVKGVEGLEIDLETGKPELIIDINRDATRRFGMSTIQIAADIRTSLFGKEISKHQAIQFKLADMATQIDAARLLCLKAAHLKDSKQDYAKASAMAKLYASRVAMDVTVEAVQIHGGYGFVKEFHVERLMRDAKITQIYEGTSEIQKIVISRAILRD